MNQRHIAPRLFAAMAAACACELQSPPSTDSGQPTDAGSATRFPARASRSSTLATARDGSYRVAVNPDLTGVVVQRGEQTLATLNLFDPGAEPSSVAVDTRRNLAWVTLRHGRALARVDAVSTAPSSTVRLTVCSEPTGVALTPHGRRAVVACSGEPLAVVVDTEHLTVTRVPLEGVARAVAITDDGDDDDLDEHAYVTQFYGAPVLEGSDTGRVGKVAEVELRQQVVTATIVLNPISDTGFGVPGASGTEGPHVACSPNQLAAIAIAGTRAFVTYTCVSPQPPLHKLTTLFSAISELDLEGRRETRAVALPRLVREQGAPEESLLGLTVDLDVDVRGETLVVLSQAANRVARARVARGEPMRLWVDGNGTSTALSFSAGGGPCAYPFCGAGADAGAPNAAGVPIGVALGEDGSVTVNDWTGRALLEVQQRRAFTYAAQPSGEREAALQLGRRFFYTGQDRWSFRDVGSCASCHPDGLSDNVTWVFGAGPRQTPALDGTFAKGDPTDHRAQNWSANFDEVYDVEGVTRNLLGGRGAICTGPAPMDTPIPLNRAIAVDADGGVSRNDNLSGSARWVVEQLSSVGDWHELERFVQQVRPNRGPVHAAPGAVERGRGVFSMRGCATCHGGPKWTVSRVPYQPSPLKNGSAPGDDGAPPTRATGLRTELREQQLPAYNRDLFKVAPEWLPNPDGGAALTVGPERITCVLRDVGTYDGADALEKKTDGTRAQGALGFNPPSLLGLATSAPYFHSGAARTLAEVFAPRFGAHGRVDGRELTDLVEFLRSIDESTEPFPGSMTVDICGGY
ncbi:MAG: hypothetical protein IPJ65_36445 [Archangiaceae bacterium]|nr:hypothetical protein [Archangiaceae bacterium]